LRPLPSRFYSLDVLRGLAALCIVLWHWPIFFWTGTTPGMGPGTPLAMGMQPLFSIFFLPYRAGLYAVDLFFTLSGFIFFWQYARPIVERTVSAREFFVLRFSRLYPLHGLTLLLVVIGQALHQRLAGSPFVYQHNDAYHFVLNVLFASSWGVEQGYSWNAPAWSISVEVALYVLFFFVCRVVSRVLPLRLPLLAGLAAVGFLVLTRVYPPLGRGLGSFYLGGCAYVVYARLVRGGAGTAVAQAVAAAALLLWAASLILTAGNVFWGLFGGLWRYAENFASIALFPLTVLALALVETQRGTFGKRVAMLGDLSYSSYLLHFPLQLWVTIGVVWLGLPKAVFLSPLSLLGFFALLLPTALLSYRCFERPAQRFIRGRWLGAPDKRRGRAN